MTSPLRCTCAVSRKRYGLLAAIQCLVPGLVAAQDLPPDTVITPPHAHADSLPTRWVFPGFPDSGPAGWATGVWLWDREALLSSTAVTLGDLLEQVPGATIVRTGFFALPETIHTLGHAGGGVEIVLDGFVLDPLGAAAYDLSRIELNQLSRVRVERRLNRMRIELNTLLPEDSRPFSHIEAGAGDLASDVLRGLFLAPDFLGGPLGLGVDRVSTDGLGRREPANTFATWLKWSRHLGPTNLQFEMRNGSVERRGEAPGRGSADRRDMALRLRGEPLPGLIAEALLGRSSGGEEAQADTTREVGTQAGVRAFYRNDCAWAALEFRHRSNISLPVREMELAAGLRVLGLTFRGDLTAADWRAVKGARSLGLRAEAASFHGLKPFAEWSRGSRGVPFLQDEDGAALYTRRSSQRVGLELNRDALQLGIAGVRIDSDSVADYGAPIGSSPRRFPGGLVRGVEMAASVPLGWQALSLQGSFNGWLPGDRRWIFMPSTNARAALVLHGLPLPSGNLEIWARLEGRHRGSMGVATTTGLATVPARGSLDFHLQIRVLDVRAFIRWENITHRLEDQDLPGRFLPGQRTFWGVKWQLWN